MWFLFSFGSALCAATSDALAKTALGTSRSQTVAWVKPGWGSLFFIPIFMMASPPSDPRLFWAAVAVALPLEILASLSFQHSLRVAPLSLSIPYLAFTPVFLLFEEWFFFNAHPTPKGWMGVLLVAVGAFLVQIDSFTISGLSLRNFIPRERGPLLMLLVAFIYSITTIFASRALSASSPFYFSSIYYFLLAAGLLPFQFSIPSWGKELIRRPFLFFCLGGVEAGSFLLQFQAMPHAEAAYVIAIKRLSLLSSVVLGGLIFKEKNIGARLVGASVMVAGAILIAFA